MPGMLGASRRGLKILDPFAKDPGEREICLCADTSQRGLPIGGAKVFFTVIRWGTIAAILCRDWGAIRSDGDRTGVLRFSVIRDRGQNCSQNTHTHILLKGKWVGISCPIYAYPACMPGVLVPMLLKEK